MKINLSTIGSQLLLAIDICFNVKMAYSIYYKQK